VIRVSAETEAQELTAENGVQAKIDWRTPDEEDPLKQAEAIEQLANIAASGIMLAVRIKKLTAAIGP
jgi:hypothetical protein